MMGVMRYWKRWLREVSDASSPETFKVRLDGAELPDLFEDVAAYCRGVGLDHL